MKSWQKMLAAVLGVVLIFATGYLVAVAVPLGPKTTYAQAALFNPDTVTNLYDTASPAVVEINVTQTGSSIFGGSLMSGQGSGFLIDKQGYILTNNHVVQGASTVQVVFKDGNTANAKVVGTDPIDDLAVISVDASAVSSITPLQLGDSSAVKPGEMAIALGSPYGLTDSITVGVISGLNRNIGGGNTSMLQTDASINPGNSGGPLLDANGSVIGINTAIENQPGARGIGFAVPSNIASKVLSSLEAGTTVNRPWLGISGMALDQSTAQSLGLSINQGVYVVSVTAGSPADKAGLKAGGVDANGNPTTGGDVITAVDGKSVASVPDLSNYFNTKNVGDTVTLTVIRGGQTISVQATLGSWPSNPPAQVVPEQPSTPNIPNWPSMPNFQFPWGRGHRGN